MRLFVAAFPPPDVLAHFVAHVAGLHVGGPRGPGRSVRLVPSDRVHLTLAFLGEVAPGRDGPAADAMAAATRRWAATGTRDEGRRRRPRLRIGGGGRFGRGRFTTVWAGIRGDTAALGDLVGDLRQELRTAKLPFDLRAYRPHVTVARPGDRLAAAELAADLAALAGYEGPQWTISAVHLVRSHPGPSPGYEKLAAAHL